jgi:Peptidase family M28
VTDVASGRTAFPAPPADAIREVVETLAPIDRTPCSPGERQAAEWLAERLRAAGVAEVAIEDEPSWGTFPPTILGLGVTSTLAAALVLRGRRRLGALFAAVGLAGLLDEIQNGPRVLRRLVRRQRTTQNVVARIGDPNAERTLVLLTHHDAAQTGRFYDQGLQQAIQARWPQLIDGRKTPPPQWWLGIVGPLLTILGALTGRRGPARASLATGALGTAIMADIARSPTVPGANDNLSGCAAVVAVAEMLRDAPVEGLRVILASCGAEETLQDGIRAFMARHDGELVQGRTWFVNFDSIGSPRLALLESEGPAWMEDFDRGFQDLVAACAEEAGIDMERGLRARASTDSIIPHRHGHPIAGLVSLNGWRMISNYHLMTDTPDRLDYGTVEDAARVAYAVAAALGAGRG